MNKIFFLLLFYCSNIFSYSVDFKIEGPISFTTSYQFSDVPYQDFKFEHENYTFEIGVIRKKEKIFWLEKVFYFRIEVYQKINNEKVLFDCLTITLLDSTVTALLGKVECIMKITINVK